METGFFKLTVLFDEPFWIGLFERERDGRYEACKVTFGAEPKDHEVYQFILDHYSRLRSARLFQRRPTRSAASAPNGCSGSSAVRSPAPVSAPRPSGI